jgi:hypothetical protein
MNAPFTTGFDTLFGKGFGGAMHDSLGYLGMSAGLGGYPLENLSLDAYLTPHIAIYCIGLKRGIIGMLCYAFSPSFLFSRPSFAAVAFWVCLTYLMTPKEALLLDMLFLRCATLDDSALLVKRRLA